MSSLKDVNKLLAGIDDEIAVERELLSQIDETQSAPVQTRFEEPVETELKEHNDDARSYLREDTTIATDYDIGPGIFEQEINMKDPFNELMLPLNSSRLLNVVETTPESIIDIVKKPLRSNAEIIETDSVKDFCTFVLEAVSEKSDVDLKSLLEGVAITLFRMVDNGLRCVGDGLEELFSRLAMALSDLTPVALKIMSKQMLQGIETDHRFTEILQAYDDICTVEDKNQLFEVITATMNYRLSDNGQQMAVTMAEQCLTKFLAPVIRGCGTQKVENFINKLIGLSIARILSDFIDANMKSVGPNRRYMSRNFKHIKSEYKKMIRHYIIKHPTIFKTFAKHYKHSEERKRRHKRKGHRNFHRKRHRHKHKHHYEKKTINNDNNEMTTIVTEEISKTEPLFRGISNTHTDVQKRYTIVETISTNSQKGIMRVSPSVLFRRKGNSVTKLTNDQENISQNLSRELGKKMLSSNNTILEKIIEESSYSDEETFLKTMLKDAYFHGNETET